jgi:hypothetical protein
LSDECGEHDHYGELWGVIIEYEQISQACDLVGKIRHIPLEAMPLRQECQDLLRRLFRVVHEQAERKRQDYESALGRGLLPKG